MPSSFVAPTGRSLSRTPNHRQQAGRRRLALVCVVLGLAIASGVIGSLAHQAAKVLPDRPSTGPFSYISAQ